MCPKSQKKDKNWTEPFEDSAFYSIAEPPLTEPFLKVLYSKKRFREKIRNLEGSVQNDYGSVRNHWGYVPTINGLVQNPQGFVFSHETFFCCTEP